MRLQNHATTNPTTHPSRSARTQNCRILATTGRTTRYAQIFAVLCTANPKTGQPIGPAQNPPLTHNIAKIG